LAKKKPQTSSSKKLERELEDGFPRFDLRDDGVRAFLDACQGDVIPPLLFIGPEGSGKEHTAVDFARRICCTAETTCSLDGDLCDSCQQAIAFENPGIYLVYPTPTQGSGEKPGDDEPDVSKILEVKRTDLFETHRFTKKVSIRIARARAIIQRANTKPFGSTHNVFVIAQADLMREEAQNALLKLVEEPPPHCAVIFVTENPDSVLHTIRSRCQRVRFSPLKPQVVETVLKSHYGVPAATARKIAELSQGNIQRARELIDEEDDEAREQAFEILSKLREAPVSWIIQNALLLTRGRSRDNVARFLHEFASVYRDVMAGDKTLFINRDKAQALAAQTTQWERKNLPMVIERIFGTRDEVLRRNLNMDAALVNLFLDIKRLGC